MRRLPCLALLVCLIACLLTPPTQAQIISGPPTYCCGPTYDYCGALNQQPSSTVTIYGIYRGRGLEVSDCNNEGNIFFGNTIRVSGWGYAQTFWFDWSSDPQAGQKANVWQSNPWSEPLTVVYDPVTMRAISVTSPSFP